MAAALIYIADNKIYNRSLRGLGGKGKMYNKWSLNNVESYVNIIYTSG
jgi:hypothetical protein